MKKAVIYARFSCSKQREASIEDQIRVCREWCAREGYTIVHEYADAAISGRTDDRPQFQQMIANAGESDICLVYMMDRFSRSEFDAPIYKRELQLAGVKLVSATESIPDSPEGIIYEKLLEGLAACESKKTSVRVKRGMEGNALKCMTNGVRIFGYKTGEDGCFAIDQEEAAWVKEAFARRIAGESIGAIADDFARRGMVSARGVPCGYSTIYFMLRNRKYTGRYEFDGFVKEGGMPRIIDEDVFWQAQEVKQKKIRAGEDWTRYLLSSRVVCSKCGHNMPGMSGHSKSGRKHEYYGCKHCDMKAVRRDWLEGELAAELRAMLSDPIEAGRVAELVCRWSEGGNGEKRARAAVNARMQAEMKLQNIMAAIEQGIVMPGLQERIDQLEAQRDCAQVELDQIRREHIDVEELTRFLQRGATLDDEKLLTSFLYRVFVFSDVVVGVLNYDRPKEKPALIRAERVLTNSGWCAVRDSNPRQTDS